MHWTTATALLRRPLGLFLALMVGRAAGLVTLLAAKAFGADAVAITDLKPPNLELAKQARAGW